MPNGCSPPIRSTFSRGFGPSSATPPSTCGSIRRPTVRQNELDLLVESIEAPWGIRYERAIKEVFNPEADDPYVASAALVEKVRELGLAALRPARAAAADSAG